MKLNDALGALADGAAAGVVVVGANEKGFTAAALEDGAAAGVVVVARGVLKFLNPPNEKLTAGAEAADVAAVAELGAEGANENGLLDALVSAPELAVEDAFSLRANLKGAADDAAVAVVVEEYLSTS